MTKLEEVARAIAAYTDPLNAARAAVQVLREPSEDMLMDGQTKIVIDEFIDGGYNYAGRNDLAEAWRTMIDAILNEKP